MGTDNVHRKRKAKQAKASPAKGETKALRISHLTLPAIRAPAKWYCVN